MPAITHTYFENIQEQLKKELNKATQSILVVIDWFTDKELYQILCDRADDGLYVSVLMLSDSTNTVSYELDIDLLDRMGGEFIIIEESGRKEIMNNKVCIIDNETVITGSDNWTMCSHNKDEKLLVTKGSRQIANEYLLTFLELRENHSEVVNEQLRSYWEEELDSLREQEMWQELLIACNSCIDELPGWDYGYHRRATAKFYMQDYQEALEDIDKALEINNEFYNAFFIRGLVKEELNDYQSAIDDFTNAIELSIDFVNAYIQRGIASYILEDYHAAINDFNEAIEMDREWINVYISRGFAKYFSGDYLGAIEDYDKAIELNSEDAETYFSRGVANYQLGEFQNAINDFSKAIWWDDKYREAYYNRAFTKSELGKYQGAIEDYDKAIELNSEYALAYNNRAIAKEKLGDEQGALEDKSIAEYLKNNQQKQ